MDALYETYAVLTFKEYEKQFWALNLKISVITVLLMWAIFAYFTVWFPRVGIPWNTFTGVLCGIGVVLLEYFSKQRVLKKTYDTNKSAQNVRIEYQFYEDYFAKHSTAGESKTEYNKLYKIIETKTRFYLMMGNNGGYILVKENFPDGLEEFLRRKKQELKRK